MTTTAHDTAAALEAAIDAYGNATAREAENADERAALHRAITAHVETEVARRLAPNLELWRWKCSDETVEQAIDAVIGSVRAGASVDDLRAAIAADKARAVEVAEDAAFIRGRDAVRKYPEGWGLMARLTPDEARRLVDALEGRAAIAAGYMADYDESELDTARTALLRALGVEL